ncbi:MAG: stage V sporulation protein SpoVM [Ruminococcus sp.]
MKIVVVKSPKLLAGLFRVIFKMKREPIEEM